VKFPTFPAPDSKLRLQIWKDNVVIRTFAGLLLALLSVGTARAEFLLLPVSSTVAAGSAVEVTLFVPNDSPRTDLVFNLPARLTLRARGAGSVPDIVLKPVDGQQMRVSIKPGGYLRARYSGPLPAGLVGNLVLEPVDFEGSALGLTATAAAAPNPGEKSLTAEEDDKDSAAATAIGPSEKDSARVAAAFSPYEPNYISGGSTGKTNAKFQISMKFRLFNPETQTPFLEKLYLAYSQTSIWAIGSSSKPFYDSSYRPSVFFLDEDVSQWPLRKTSRLGFQAGVEHESNGKDGDSSRSIMIAYVRPTFTLPFAERYFVSISPKIYAYLEKDDNPDIPYYRGYSDVLVKVGQTDGMQLATTLRKGTGEDPYSVELDLSYPLKIARLGNLGGYLHLQYFNGYGESLIDYNQKVRSQFRIGLMITR
jgi:outer membrane phospholipase A